MTQKYPLAQKCFHQNRFFNTGNSSNSFFVLRSFTRLIISIGAKCGSAERDHNMHVIITDSATFFQFQKLRMHALLTLVITRQHRLSTPDTYILLPKQSSIQQ